MTAGAGGANSRPVEPDSGTRAQATVSVTAPDPRPVGDSYPTPGAGLRGIGSDSDPWTRWGWLMGVIWLVFLIFPLRAAVHQDSIPLGALSVAAILTFATLYALGMRRVFVDADGLGYGTRVIVLVALVGLCGLAAIGIGIEALGMAPFVIAWVMFTQPMRLSIVLILTVLALAGGIPLLLDRPAEAVLFFSICSMVTIATLVPRVLSAHDEEYQLVAKDLLLVAERERLARDVHDVLGHSLTVVAVKAELAERVIGSDPDRSAAELRDIQSLTRQALAEVRSTVSGLRIARLDDELTSARTVLGSANIELHVTGQVADVDPRHRIVTAWVVREAVTNIVRHSRAGRAWIEIGPNLTVIGDDGIGMDAGAGSCAGNGLTGLRERVTGAGGRLELHSGPERAGTVLEVRW